jgi:hypothetical protein
MNRKLPIALSILILLYLSAVATASAQTRAPGVSQGNTFVYKQQYFWNSSDPNADIPSNLLEKNNTELHFNVTATVSSRIYYEITEAGEGWIDVQTGENGNPGIYPLAPIFCGANLTVNDSMALANFQYMPIAETENMTYLFGARQTNRVNLDTNNLRDLGWIPEDYSGNGYLYFDKNTGVLVEVFFTSEGHGEATGLLWRLNQSNVWTIPEFPTCLITLLLITTTLLLAIIYKRKVNRN